MSRHVPITRGAWILLGLSTVIAGLGFALPRLRPVPTHLDPELSALRGERDVLAVNDDATLENLRQQSRKQPQDTWSAVRLTDRVGTGWRVEWQRPDGDSRAVLFSRSAPRLHEWPDYLRFLKSWTDLPGVAFESLDVSAGGPAQAREFTRVVIGLRLILADAPIGDAERAAPSRGPLPVAPASSPAIPRKVGPGPPLRPPATSAEPPADGPASASSRPDPPGPWAGVYQTTPPINPNPT